jgi:hypothetical protein
VACGLRAPRPSSPSRRAAIRRLSFAVLLSVQTPAQLADLRNQFDPPLLPPRAVAGPLTPGAQASGFMARRLPSLAAPAS